MAKKRIPELKIEQINHTVNLHFLALVEYKREEYLCVIDNITSAEIGVYVLDFVEQESISTSEFLSLVIRWFYEKSDLTPLSVEIARQGLIDKYSMVYRTFDTAYVSRIIGQAFSYEAMNKSKVRRRRIIPIPAGIEIRFKKL